MLYWDFHTTTVSRGYTEWCDKTKTHPVRGRKQLGDERDQKTIVRLVRTDRQAAVTQITTVYNRGEKESQNAHVKP